MSKRNLFFVIPAALALTLSACGGGGDAARPTVDEVTDLFTSGAEEMGGVAIPEEQATCMAQGLVDSDLSDEALRAMVDLDEGYEASDADNEFLQGDFLTIATDCVTG